jgi:hypothetical protein
MGTVNLRPSGLYTGSDRTPTMYTQIPADYLRWPGRFSGRVNTRRLTIRALSLRRAPCRGRRLVRAPASSSGGSDGRVRAVREIQPAGDARARIRCPTRIWSGMGQ